MGMIIVNGYYNVHYVGFSMLVYIALPCYRVHRLRVRVVSFRVLAIDALASVDLGMRLGTALGDSHFNRSLTTLTRSSSSKNIPQPYSFKKF